jgi:hypothetical protein
MVRSDELWFLRSNAKSRCPGNGSAAGTRSADRSEGYRLDERRSGQLSSQIFPACAHAPTPKPSALQTVYVLKHRMNVCGCKKSVGRHRVRGPACTGEREWEMSGGQAGGYLDDRGISGYQTIGPLDVVEQSQSRRRDTAASHTSHWVCVADVRMLECRQFSAMDAFWLRA